VIRGAVLEELDGLLAHRGVDGLHGRGR
jgi:hypothetical protein